MIKLFKPFKNTVAVLSFLPLLLVSKNAFAFQKATDLINSFKNWLTAISVTVITIAIMVAGYKILFQGQSFREVAPILIGGILIGAAASIAGIFI